MLKIIGRLRGSTEKVQLDEVSPSNLRSAISFWANQGYLVATSA